MTLIRAKLMQNNALFIKMLSWFLMNVIGICSFVFDLSCILLKQGASGLSAPGCLMAELEDALAKQRPNCMSDSALSKSRENRLESHIQHRLTELEG